MDFVHGGAVAGWTRAARARWTPTRTPGGPPVKRHRAPSAPLGLFFSFRGCRRVGPTYAFWLLRAWEKQSALLHYLLISSFLFGTTRESYYEPMDEHHPFLSFFFPSQKNRKYFVFFPTTNTEEK